MSSRAMLRGSIPDGMQTEACETPAYAVAPGTVHRRFIDAFRVGGGNGLTATRRGFMRQGGLALAGTCVPVAAQERAPASNAAAAPPLAAPVMRTLMACAEAITG